MIPKKNPKNSSGRTDNHFAVCMYCFFDSGAGCLGVCLFTRNCSVFSQKRQKTQKFQVVEFVLFLLLVAKPID